MRDQKPSVNGAEWSEEQKQIYQRLTEYFLCKQRLALLERRTSTEEQILKVLNRQVEILKKKVEKPPSPPCIEKTNVHLDGFMKELKEKQAAAAQLDAELAAMESPLPNMEI